MSDRRKLTGIQRDRHGTSSLSDSSLRIFIRSWRIGMVASSFAIVAATVARSVSFIATRLGGIGCQPCNVTGSGKRLGLLREIVPAATLIGIAQSELAHVQY